MDRVWSTSYLQSRLEGGELRGKDILYGPVDLLNVNRTEKGWGKSYVYKLPSISG